MLVNWYSILRVNGIAQYSVLYWVTLLVVLKLILLEFFKTNIYKGEQREVEINYKHGFECKTW